jgi:hypothetical protein
MKWRSQVLTTATTHLEPAPQQHYGLEIEQRNA